MLLVALPLVLLCLMCFSVMLHNLRQHMLFRADELDEQRYGSFAAVEEPRQLNEDDPEWLVYVSKLNNN